MQKQLPNIQDLVAVEAIANGKYDWDCPIPQTVSFC